MPQKYTGEVETQLHSLMTLALGGHEKSTSHPTTLPRQEHLVGQRASMDILKIERIVCLCLGSNPGFSFL